jgi:alpha-tubulin suppressor-like RCC1 family protein
LFCTGTVFGATNLVFWGSNTYGERNFPPGITNLVSLAGGGYHVVGLRADQTSMAWGMNTYGQTNVPPDATNLMQATAGEFHSAGRRPDGSVSFWGTLYFNGSNLPPSVTKLAVLGTGPNAEHLLALRKDGSVFAYGGIHRESNIPPSASNGVAVAAGGQFSVLLRGDGSVAVWGDNTGGQTNVPASATNIVAVSAGANHVLGLRADGTLLSWGSISSIPNYVFATNILDIASGSDHIVAVRRDGTVIAYGNNTYGQTTVPTGTTNITAIAATKNSSLALAGGGAPVLAAPLVDRTLPSGSTAYFRMMAYGQGPISYQWQWNGTNIPGATNSLLALSGLVTNQAGTYSVTASNLLGTAASEPCLLAVVPLQIKTHPQSQNAYVGQQVTLRAEASGLGPLTYQWKFNGTDLPGATDSSLVFTSATAAQSGWYCLAVTNAYAWAVSSNAYLNVVPILITGQPENRTSFPGGTMQISVTAQAALPITYQWHFAGIPLAGATNSMLVLSNLLRSQAGSYDVSLSTASDSTNSAPANLAIIQVAAWGDDGAGGTNMPPNLSNVVAVAAGEVHYLALRTDGSVVGWGSLVPATVPTEATNVTMIRAGVGHSLALRRDGKVIAWGYGNFGVTTVPSALTNAIAIAAGDYHNLALQADGTVIAWGRNSSGATNPPTGLSNVVAIAAGSDSSLALRQDGTVVVWGSATNGPADLSDVVAISAGSGLLALKADGRTVAWATSAWNEGSTTVTDAVAVASGFLSSLALRADGTVVPSGYPYNGQLAVPAGLSNVVEIALNQVDLAVVGDAPRTPDTICSSAAFTDTGFKVGVQSRNGRVYRLEFKNSLTTEFPHRPQLGFYAVGRGHRAVAFSNRPQPTRLTALLPGKAVVAS